MTKLTRKNRRRKQEEPVDATEALAATLQGAPVEDLSDLYDQLKLLGVVVGQIALLEAATSGGDMKAKVSAARALASLKENPAEIAERLKASPFARLSSADLRKVVDQIKDGDDPRRVLQLVVEEKEKTA